MRQFALPTPARRTAGALTAAALTVSGVAAITAAASSASAALPATATLAAVSHPASAVNELTMQRAEQAISRSHQRAAVQAVTESRLQRQAQAAAQSADAIDVHKKQQAKAAKAAKDAAAKKAAAKRAAAALAAARKDPQSVARSLLSEYGFGADQFGCLVQLWTGESDWNYRAANPSSGAYGIPQSLPGSKMASAGADWQTNPATQIRWGLGYIKASYGTPCGALSAWQSRYPHWY